MAILQNQHNHSTIEPEPHRDWKFGPFSGHRFRVIFLFVGGIVLLYLIQAYLWPTSKTPHTFLEHVWTWGALVWLGSFVPAFFGMIGALIFDHPRHLHLVKPIKTLVSWRIVSRGTNKQALTHTILRCQKEMKKTPLFPYIVEVVTDLTTSEGLPQAPEIHYIFVPHSYSTENDSLYKARALHYAAVHSELPDRAWIVHLDEESHPTASGIKGICSMIADETQNNTTNIGQGPILYHRKWKAYPLLTLADMIRTGDDLARFHLQHKIGITIFGLHGSYIVVRNDVEKSIGFDFGPKGSITEDTYWALLAMEEGHRCRWVDGYLEEQSTHSYGDFIRQRRRWYVGLTHVAFYAPVKLRWRIALGINTLLWTAAPFSCLYTIGHLLYGYAHPWWLVFLANFSFSAFTTFYLIGLKVNLDEYGIKNFWQRKMLYVLQIVTMPLFSLLEGIGVAAAVFFPNFGFHIVKK